METTTATANADQAADATDPIPTHTDETAPVGPTGTPDAGEPVGDACDWEGHDTAVDEHGWCPVCQPGDDPTPEEVDAGVAAWSAVQQATSPLAAACAIGDVKLYKERANGTLRALPWLVGEQREHAEWALEELAAGASVAEVCEAGAWSRSTIRRMLAMVDVMEQIEAGEWDDLYDEDVTALILYVEGDESDEA